MAGIPGPKQNWYGKHVQSPFSPTWQAYLVPIMTKMATIPIPPPIQWQKSYKNLAENHKIQAVAARSKDSAQKLADAFDIETVYEGYDGLATDQNINIVYIGSINSAHYDLWFGYEAKMTGMIGEIQ